MPNTCHSTLKVYGPTHLAERARSMIKPVFGPCLADYSNPFLKAEPDNPPLAVVRIESREVPPVSIVEEMSKHEPDLVFELVYSNWASGVRGSRVYRGGDVTSETQGAFQIEDEAMAGAGPERDNDSRAAASLNPSRLDFRPPARQESEPGQTAVQNGETPSAGASGGAPPSRRDHVSSCLDRFYALLHKKQFHHCTLTPDEEIERDVCSATINAFKQQMNDADRFYIEQLEEQYSLGMSRYFYRLKLHDRLAQCLHEFSNPAFSELLDAADHETLQGLPRVLEKLDVRQAGHVLSK
jgi:hypothetical protein